MSALLISRRGRALVRNSAVAALIAASMPGHAGDASASAVSADWLVPLPSDPGGQSAAESVRQWTQWIYSFDTIVDGGDPVSDTTGEFQTMKQTFPVHMLGGAQSAGVERAFKVGVGKPLFVPLVNVFCFGPEPDFSCLDFLDFAQGLIDDVDEIFETVSGHSLIEADTLAEVDALEAEHRVYTGIFPLELVENNRSGAVPGLYEESFNTGFYAALKLPVGRHLVEYGGAFLLPDGGRFFNSVRAEIEVVPAPGALGLLAGAAAALAAAGRRRSRRTG